MSTTDREAIRTACLDVAQQVEDSTSAIVEALCQDCQGERVGKARPRCRRDDRACSGGIRHTPTDGPRSELTRRVTRHGDDGEVMQGQYGVDRPADPLRGGRRLPLVGRTYPGWEHQPGIRGSLEQPVGT